MAVSAPQALATIYEIVTVPAVTAVPIPEKILIDATAVLLLLQEPPGSPLETSVSLLPAQSDVALAESVPALGLPEHKVYARN